MANIFIKLTFFILYWSIFYPFRWLRYAILGGAAVVTGVYTGFLMYMLISDTPRPGQTWLEKAQEKRERGTSGGVRSAMPIAVWCLVTDIYILLLPISGVARLQLSRKKRIALLTVFMTAIGSVCQDCCRNCGSRGSCLLTAQQCLYLFVLEYILPNRAGIQGPDLHVGESPSFVVSQIPYHPRCNAERLTSPPSCRALRRHNDHLCADDFCFPTAHITAERSPTIVVQLDSRAAT